MSVLIRLSVFLLLLFMSARPAAAQGGPYTISLDAAVNGYVIGPGIDCGAGRSDCVEIFGGPTTITLSAVPNPGYVFLGWAGLDCIGAETVVLVVNGAKVCRPVFNATPGGPGMEVPNYAANAAFLDLPFGTGGVTPPGGRSQLVFAPPHGQVVPIVATANAVAFRIDHPALTNTTIRMSAAPNEPLTPSLFEPTTGSLFTLSEPFLEVTYNSVSCKSDGGRFRIYEITFAGPTLSAFSADFEVGCPNGGIATGSIRYNAARASLLPFDGVAPSSTVTVTVTLGGYVTSAAGIDCGDGGRTDCEEAFEPPSVVSLQAIASPGYAFLGWGGICGGSDRTLTMTVNTSGRCLAAFYPVAGAPSHPFGENFLIIDGSGTSSSRSVWLPPEGIVEAGASGSFVGFIASGTSGSASVNFGLAAGRISVGDYDAVPAWDVDPYVLDRRPARITLSGCSVTRGFFRVYEASYELDGRLASFAADFEAYCSGLPSYVAGAVRFRASRDRVVPFDGAYPVLRLAVAPSPYGRIIAPGIVCDPITSDCAEIYPSVGGHPIQAIPNPGYAFAGWTGDCSGGSYSQVFVDRTTWCDPLFRAVSAGLPEDMRLARGTLTIQSQPGDPIGNGISKTYVVNAWSVLSDSSRRTLTVSPAYPDWRMEFRVPTGSVLSVGDYDGAVGMSGSPALAALSLRRLTGQSCDSSARTGRFTILEIRFASPTSSSVESLAVDFEQRCNNGPALRGSIRYRSSRSVLRPLTYDEGPPYARFDFTGDESPDLVWQNRNDGRLLLWHVSGITYTFNEPSSIPQISDPSWHIVGTADADSDGYNDLYWQHQTTGELAIWYMRGTQVQRTDLLTQVVSDTNWQIRTVFDVDRDGQPDLLWQHRVSGHIAVWYMNDGAFRSSQLVGPGQITDPAWTIVGAGDANGDGRPDLYWQHPITGQLAVWYMDGVRMVSTTMLTPSSVADTNWRVRGVADLNHDGSPDLVWQNVSTSDVAVWMLNGSRFVESRLIKGPTMPAAEWVLVGPR